MFGASFAAVICSRNPSDPMCAQIQHNMDVAQPYAIAIIVAEIICIAVLAYCRFKRTGKFF